MNCVNCKVIKLERFMKIMQSMCNQNTMIIYKVAGVRDLGAVAI